MLFIYEGTHTHKERERERERERESSRLTVYVNKREERAGDDQVSYITSAIYNIEVVDFAYENIH